MHVAEDHVGAGAADDVDGALDVVGLAHDVDGLGDLGLHAGANERISAGLLDLALQRNRALVEQVEAEEKAEIDKKSAAQSKDFFFRVRWSLGVGLGWNSFFFSCDSTGILRKLIWCKSC